MFDPRQIHVPFEVDKVELPQVSLSVFQFSRTGIIPPMLHPQLILRLSLTEIQADEAFECCDKAIMA